MEGKDVVFDIPKTCWAGVVVRALNDRTESIAVVSINADTEE